MGYFSPLVMGGGQGAAWIGHSVLNLSISYFN